MCGSVSGGVRGRLKLSGNLSTALCNGVAMCSSAHIFVRQWADMCGSAHIFVQQWVDMCGSVTRRVHSGCVHQCVREMVLSMRLSCSACGSDVRLFGSVTVRECIQK